MKLYYLRINNLFNKYSVELDLDKNLNVLLGANGVGKSTILKILDCLFRNDFLSLTLWDFSSLELGVFDKGDKKIKDKIVIEKNDFFPDKETLIHDYGVRTSRDVDSISHREQYIRRWFDNLEKEHLYYQFLSASLLGLEYSNRINRLLYSFHVSLVDPDWTEFRRCIQSFENKGLIGSCKYLNNSHLNDILHSRNKDKKDVYSKSWYEVFNQYYRSDLYYIDLVDKVYFTEHKYPEAVYTSNLLKWMKDINKVDGLGDYRYEVNPVDPFMYLRSPYYLLDIPAYIAYFDNGQLLSMYLNLFSKINDFTTLQFDENDGRTLWMNEVCIENFIKSREFDIDKMISEKYYYYSVADVVNKKAASFCNEIISGKYSYLDDGMKFIDKEDIEKYKDIVYDTDFASDYIERYFVDFENRNDIINYIMPIICEDFIVSPRKLLKAIDKEDDFGNDEIAVVAYACYLFYKTILKDLKSPKLKSKKVKNLELVLNKYLHDKSVKIYPSGIKIYMKELYSDEKIRSVNGYDRGEISLNELASGEKKLVLLFSMLLLNDNLTVLIDEPELSLSIVWQENLLSDILQYGGKNKIIIATHSPYLVSKPELQSDILFLPQEEI